MKRTPLRRRSAARESAAYRSARREAVDAAMSRDGGCVAAALVPEIPCQGVLDGHEPLTRGRGGDPCDPDNVVTVCRVHHDHLHAHPIWATEVGLLRRSS